MWPFQSKKDPEDTKARDNNFPDWPEPEIFAPISKLNENAAELRFFLPELCFQALKAMADERKTWISGYVREFFVVFLYGELTLRRMRKENSGIYYVPPPVERDGYDSGIRFSRRHRTETVPGLGKNICPVKIFIPQRLKDDFQKAADISNMPLSTMVREALIAHFLGNRILLERYGSWTAGQQRIGEAWEMGELESVYFDEDESIPVENVLVQ